MKLNSREDSRVSQNILLINQNSSNNHLIVDVTEDEPAVVDDRKVTYDEIWEGTCCTSQESQVTVSADETFNLVGSLAHEKQRTELEKLSIREIDPLRLFAGNDLLQYPTIFKDSTPSTLLMGYFRSQTEFDPLAMPVRQDTVYFTSNAVFSPLSGYTDPLLPSSLSQSPEKQ